MDDSDAVNQFNANGCHIKKKLRKKLMTMTATATATIVHLSSLKAILTEEPFIIIPFLNFGKGIYFNRIDIKDTHVFHESLGNIDPQRVSPVLFP
jgi:hypothetical protein